VITAATISFAILLVAWLVAPSDRRQQPEVTPAVAEAAVAEAAVAEAA
jgi:hypothetical protein